MKLGILAIKSNTEIRGAEISESGLWYGVFLVVIRAF